MSKKLNILNLLIRLPIKDSINILNNRFIKRNHKLFEDKYYKVKFFGGKIFLNLNESKNMILRAYNKYETDKVNLFKKLIKPGATIIDIGSNKGYFTFIAAKLLKNNGKVFSFEPDPTNCHWIRKSISENKYSNIILIPVGIYNTNSKTTFYKGDKSGHHSLKKDRGLGNITINTKTIDSLLEEENIQRVDIIKIDVEGSEVEVLEGGKNTLNNHAPIIILDIHDYINKSKLFEILNSNEYYIYTYKDLNFKKLTYSSFSELKPKEILCSKKPVEQII